jgi:hypothetical protein
MRFPNGEFVIAPVLPFSACLDFTWASFRGGPQARTRNPYSAAELKCSTGMITRLPSHFDCGVWIPDRRCAALALGGLVAVGVMAGVRNDAHGLSGAGAPGSARGLRDPSGACEAPWWAGPLRSGRPRARYLERGLQDPPPGARAKIRKAGLRGLPPGRCASRRSTAERAFAHPAAGGHRRAAGPGRGSAARHDGAAEFASSTRTTA